MHNKNAIARLSAAMLAVGMAAIPIQANAQSHNRGWQSHQSQDQRRRDEQRHKEQMREHSARLAHDRQNRAHQEQERLHRLHVQQAHERAMRINNDRLRASRNAAELRARNERLRIERNNAVARANRARYDANHRTVVVHNVYRPQVIYRTAPAVTYRYTYENNTPRWYPEPPPNEWRSIAGIAGGVSLLGLLEHDNRLVFAGNQGAPYSFQQYNLDNVSTVPAYRLRAAYFRRPFIYRDGHRYDRVVIVERGRHYYRFVRRY